jgi:hypothetical protein
MCTLTKTIRDALPSIDITVSTSMSDVGVSIGPFGAEPDYDVAFELHSALSVCKIDSPAGHRRLTSTCTSDAGYRRFEQVLVGEHHLSQ